MKIRYKNLLILSILILASCVAAVCLNRLIVGAYCLAAGAVILLFAVFAPELTIRKEWIKELTLLLNACAAFAVIELITGALFGIDPISMLYNVLIIYLFGKVIETIFGSPKIAMISIQVFGLFSGIAEYYVVLFRGTPIVPWDLIVLKTAATVFSAYEFHYPKQIYLMVMVFIGMIAVIQKLHYEADHKNGSFVCAAAVQR